MEITPLDSELSKQWAKLTTAQKRSLVSVIKLFVHQGEESSGLELQEAEVEYNFESYSSQEELLKQLKESEKKSLLLLIKTFLQTRDQNFQHVSIDQYNKEIDEAMKRIDAGEFITQEDLENEAEQW